jgi:hypothetical protein
MTKRVEECEDPLRCHGTIAMHKYERVGKGFEAADTWHRPFANANEIRDHAAQLRECIKYNEQLISDFEAKLALSELHMQPEGEHRLCIILRDGWESYRRYPTEPKPGLCQAQLNIKEIPGALEELKKATGEMEHVLGLLLERVPALDANCEPSFPSV